MKLKELGWREKALGGGYIVTAIAGYGSEDVAAFVVRHPLPEGGGCEGLVPIDPKYARGKQPWVVESWDQLTISPSIVCTEHDVHGHIRNGLWVDA
ncbi:MAG: hypothetical protein ACRDIX_07250 [Actinomycetota bacterium]